MMHKKGACVPVFSKLLKIDWSIESSAAESLFVTFNTLHPNLKISYDSTENLEKTTIREVYLILLNLIPKEFLLRTPPLKNYTKSDTRPRKENFVRSCSPSYVFQTIRAAVTRSPQNHPWFVSFFRALSLYPKFLMHPTGDTSDPKVGHKTKWGKLILIVCVEVFQLS